MPGMPMSRACDEQQAVVCSVVLVAQVLDSGGGQAFGFVDDEQFDVVGRPVLTDTGVDVHGRCRC